MTKPTTEHLPMHNVINIACANAFASTDLRLSVLLAEDLASCNAVPATASAGDRLIALQARQADIREVNQR
ncbi:hypothetical protein [Pseudomonas sp. Z2-11]